jgi:putative peptide zinc metalloprotease protein
LVRLIHPELEQEQIRIEGEVRQHRVRLDQLERRRVAEPEAAQAIPAVREALRDFEQQLAQLQTAAERLVLKAPVSGIVLPSLRQAPPTPAGTLPSWTGTPLDPRNNGCFLRAGTMVCLVGAAESRTALALISQDDINLIKVGQGVRLHWNELAGEVLTGQVVEIAALDLDLLSHDVITRLSIPARATASGGLRPIGTWYQARVRLDETNAPLVRNSAGRATILTEPLSLGTRALRWLNRTFPL